MALFSGRGGVEVHNSKKITELKAQVEELKLMCLKQATRVEDLENLVALVYGAIPHPARELHFKDEDL